MIGPRVVMACLAALVIASHGRAQQPPVLDVAVIKPADPSTTQKGISFGAGGRTVNIRGVTVVELIQRSYNVFPSQISGGPPWISSARYSASAKAEDGPPVSPDQFPAMLQRLLADRFGLKLHRETKEFPVLALTVGKNGPKLKTGGSEGPNLSTSRGQVKAAKIPMPMFATALGRYLGRPVIDETGLGGSYDFQLKWTPGETEQALPPGEEAAFMDASGTSLFAALQEQLGLKLESKKGPLEVLVIDSAEKPSEN